MRIAVIEDNEALAQGIAHRLRDRGHAVDLLHDGEDADIFLRHEGADLIVLDCNLPGCDGLEVLSRLRRRGDGTPVILLTARAETSERVAGLDAGADDYLTKPFEMDELEARLRAMARRKNLEFAARDAIGPLVFDRTNRQLLEGEQPLAFPRKELATLECTGTARTHRVEIPVDHACLWHRCRAGRQRHRAACVPSSQTVRALRHPHQSRPWAGLYA